MCRLRQAWGHLTAGNKAAGEWSGGVNRNAKLVNGKNKQGLVKNCGYLNLTLF